LLRASSRANRVGHHVPPTLETMCGENGAKGKDLAAHLQWLVDNGVIDKNLHDWATELRFLGNDAAHELDPIERQDAPDASELVDATLNYLYTYRRSFEDFKRRRSQRKHVGK